MYVYVHTYAEEVKQSDDPCQCVRNQKSVRTTHVISRGIPTKGFNTVYQVEYQESKTYGYHMMTYTSIYVPHQKYVLYVSTCVLYV